MDQSTITPELKKKVATALMDNLRQTAGSIADTVSIIQDAAQSEEEYSANRQGDKQEEMMTDVELHDQISADLSDRAQVLHNLNLDVVYTTVEAGALVRTSLGNFLIGAVSPTVEVDGERYMGVSLAAPMIAAMAGHKVGDSVNFQDKTCAILAIG